MGVEFIAGECPNVRPCGPGVRSALGYLPVSSISARFCSVEVRALRTASSPQDSDCHISAWARQKTTIPGLWQFFEQLVVSVGKAWQRYGRACFLGEASQRYSRAHLGPSVT